MPILDLPVETLGEIFSQLSRLRDLLACELVCSLFHGIIKNSTRLEYRIELERAGMIDNPQCKLTTVKRLEMLHQRERAWREFNWVLRVPNITVPSTSSEKHIVTATSVMLGVVDLDSPSMGVGFKQTGFQAIDLPSVGPENMSRAWKTTMDVGEEIFEFGTAAEEHDLLAYITLFVVPNNPTSNRQTQIWLVFRHYSDPSKAHQRAILPRVLICSMDTATNYDLPRLSIAISGENVAITVRDEFAYQTSFDSENHLYVFDWKTGYNKTTTPLKGSFRDPVFLRDDILLVPCSSPFCLQVYYIPSSTSLSSSIRLIISLNLPALAAHKIVKTIRSQCTPNPTQNSEIPINTSSTRPFLSDPSVAIIVFSITVVGSEFELEHDDFRMVVHRRALLNLIPLHLLEVATAAATVIPWTIWGPPVTRWLIMEVDHLSPQTNMHSYGQRYVDVGGEGSSDEDDDDVVDEDDDGVVDNQFIMIWDFNPSRVQEVRLHQAKYTADARGDQSSVFEVEVVGGGDSDVCFANGVFKFDIVGQLPYVLYCRSKWHVYDDILIDEERLIGVQTEQDISGITSMDILYFG